MGSGSLTKPMAGIVHDVPPPNDLVRFAEHRRGKCTSISRAVSRLMMNWCRETVATGRSPGLAPFEIFIHA